MGIFNGQQVFEIVEYNQDLYATELKYYTSHDTPRPILMVVMVTMNVSENLLIFGYENIMLQNCQFQGLIAKFEALKIISSIWSTSGKYIQDWLLGS